MPAPTMVVAGKHPLSSQTILIAGAGLASLSFIRALLLSWPPSHPAPRLLIYERDPHSLPAVRGHYSLGRRSDAGTSGLQALRGLGLLDEVVAARAPEGGGAGEGMMIRRARPHGDGWEVLAQKAAPGVARAGLPVAKMRITRSALRAVLLQGVEDAAAATGIEVDFNWETYCTAAARLPSGKMEVRLNTAETVECDLLIVADGASSRLRACLRPDDPLRYAGVTALCGHATFAARAEVPRELWEGSGVVLGGDGHGCVVFPLNEEGTFVWFLTRKEAEPREAGQRGHDAATQQAVLCEEARREGAVFGAAFEALLEATEPGSFKVFNAKDKPPIRHTHVQDQPVVYIGDANHAMRYAPLPLFPRAPSPPISPKATNLAPPFRPHPLTARHPAPSRAPEPIWRSWTASSSADCSRAPPI